MGNSSQGRPFGSGATPGARSETGTTAPSTAFTGSESDPGKTSDNETKATAGPSVEALKEGLRETARAAGGVIRDQATQLAQDIGHELRKTGERQISSGAEAIRQFARAIDNAANELEEQSPTIARSVHEAASRVNRLSDNLGNRDIAELIDSATRLARTQPVLFLGGSVVAGFAMARFLKSSGRNRSGAETGYASRSYEQTSQPTF